VERRTVSTRQCIASKITIADGRDVRAANLAASSTSRVMKIEFTFTLKPSKH
jgi:hypothetical protein